MEILQLIKSKGINSLYTSDSIYDFLTSSNVYEKEYVESKFRRFENSESLLDEQFKNIIDNECIKNYNSITYTNVTLAENEVTLVLSQNREYEECQYPEIEGNLLGDKNITKILFAIRKLNSRGISFSEVEGVAVFHFRNFSTSEFSFKHYTKFPFSFAIQIIKTTYGRVYNFNTILFFNYQETHFSKISIRDLLFYDKKLPKNEIDWPNDMLNYKSKIRRLNDFIYLIETSYCRHYFRFKDQYFSGSVEVNFLEQTFTNPQYNFGIFSRD